MATNTREWKLNKLAVLILVILALLVAALSARLIFHRASVKPASISAFGKNCVETGIASWYDENKAGHPTASGEKYDPKALTAAHRKFPFGTELTIINLENGRKVTVKVNDRGPYKNNRILDLSSEAAHQLGMKKPGLVAVCIEDPTITKR